MKEYLPIGSVVMLGGGDKTIMIYGRRQIHSQTNTMYDYVACLYPEGNLTEEYTYLFNHDKIVEILFEGYKNEDEEKFLKVLNDAE